MLVVLYKLGLNLVDPSSSSSGISASKRYISVRLSPLY